MMFLAIRSTEFLIFHEMIAFVEIYTIYVMMFLAIRSTEFLIFHEMITFVEIYTILKFPEIVGFPCLERHSTHKTYY